MGYVLFKSCDAIVTCDEKDTTHRGADLLINGAKWKKLEQALQLMACLLTYRS